MLFKTLTVTHQLAPVPITTRILKAPLSPNSFAIVATIVAVDLFHLSMPFQMDHLQLSAEVAVATFTRVIGLFLSVVLLIISMSKNTCLLTKTLSKNKRKT